MRKIVDPLLLLKHYLSQGYDMCYADANEERQKIARKMGGKAILIESYKPTAVSTHHRDITIAVNPDLSPSAYNDWIFISYTNIYVFTSEKI